ncbi:MAG TPA: DNA cytosine methyltransferase [Phycisphaerae bacterium]|nr:DNA cytosine methyltransferase [Phycisphaerae bacterium]
MSVYYNDNDPACQRWLRKLMRARVIPKGNIDGRSIRQVQTPELRGYDQCHFFAGVGGWAFALRLARWEGPVWTGSCPCQPFSVAGRRRGRRDERHLWPLWWRLIAECHPPVIFGEQVASALGREWLSGVRSSLESVGYSVGAADLCAAGVGAPHIRQRLFWVADAEPDGRKGAESTEWPKASRGRRPAESSQEAGRLAYSNGGNAGDGGIQRGGEHRQRAKDGGTGGLELAPNDGRDEGGAEPGGRDVAGGCGTGRLGDAGGAERPTPRARGPLSEVEGQGTRAVKSLPASEYDGPWGDFALIPCADGKLRRVPAESQLLGVADGLPACLADLPAECGFPLARKGAVADRAVILRGIGNAIVPQVAATFVKAYMET